MGTSEQQRAGAARAERIGEANRAALESARAADDAQQNSSPLRMSTFAKELVQHLPEDAIIFDEAITHSPELTHWFRPGKPGHYFQTPGGTLGVDFPGAIGVKLAHPNSTVIGFSGDGGCMYTHQALWTAAHHRIGAKFIVVNNHSYRILKLNIIQYWRDLGLSPNEFPSNFPPSFDLGDPSLGIVTIARGLGVEGTRVTERDEIAPAIDAMLKQDGPFLIDLVVDASVPRPTA